MLCDRVLISKGGSPDAGFPLSITPIQGDPMASTCPECGNPLPPREPGQPGRDRLYCSPQHKDRAKSRRYRDQAHKYRELVRQLKGEAA